MPQMAHLGAGPDHPGAPLARGKARDGKCIQGFIGRQDGHADHCEDGRDRVLPKRMEEALQGVSTAPEHKDSRGTEFRRKPLLIPPALCHFQDLIQRVAAETEEGDPWVLGNCTAYGFMWGVREDQLRGGMANQVAPELQRRRAMRPRLWEIGRAGPSVQLPIRACTHEGVGASRRFEAFASVARHVSLGRPHYGVGQTGVGGWQ